MQKHAKLYKIAWVICALVWAVSGIKQTKEPDFWWQLRTGEWMLDNGQVTRQDVFSFTYAGTPWVNVKWLYEIVIATISRASAPEMVHLLQVLVNLLIITLLYRIVQAARAGLQGRQQNTYSFALLLFAYIVLFCAQPRLNGRPEMSSHLMLLLYLLIYFIHRFKDYRWAYALIPLQLLWTNLHEAFGIGTVLLVIMMGSAWFEYLILREKGRYPHAWHMSLAAILAIVAISFNPHGPIMILHPFEIFRQVETNIYTSESFPYTDPAYWTFESYAHVIVLALALLLLFVPINKQEKWWKRPLHWGPAFPLLLVLFFYLSLKANRNIPFTVFIAFPVLVVGSDELLRLLGQRLKKLSSLFSKIQVGVAVLLIIAGISIYIFIASGAYYRQFNPRVAYGLKVMKNSNPLRAAAFIKQQKLQGPCFSDYLTSSCLLWELQPHFKTYIDLRDMDIFPDSFFKQFFAILYQPQRFEKADSLYQFNYAVVYRPLFDQLHRYLQAHEEWVTAYADPVAVVYLKKNAVNAAVIEKLTAGAIERKGDIFMYPEQELPATHPAAMLVSKLFNPFWDEEEEENKQDYDQIAASFYVQTLQPSLSLSRAHRSAEKNNSPDAWNGLGTILLQWSQLDDKRREAYWAEAQAAFNKSIEQDKQNSNAWMGLGQLALQQNDAGLAQSYFKKSLQFNPSNAAAHIYMTQALLSASGGNANDKTYQAMISHLKKATHLQPENVALHFQLGILYCQYNDCDKGVPLLEKYMGDVSISPKDMQLARDMLQQCR